MTPAPDFRAVMRLAEHFIDKARTARDSAFEPDRDDAPVYERLALEHLKLAEVAL